MNTNKILRTILRPLNDQLYISLMYYYHFKRFPDLKNPELFNEKLQWLKLHDRRPEYIYMVDKIQAKKYVATIIGQQHIIPTIDVWSSFSDVKLKNLPNKFVLKTNHDSKGVVVCRDKSKFEWDTVKRKLESHLRVNGYYYGREWPYKNVVPQLFAEKYMEDAPGTNCLTDYKFYCFNGYVDCVMICCDRESGDTKYYFFDKDWKLKRINKRGVEAPLDFTLPKPECMDEMFEIAAALSKGIPFVRVDLYVSDHTVYFGELTLYPASGFDVNYLPETDKYFGSLINLSLAYDKYLK